MQAEYDIGPEPESFAGAAARWDTARFGSWIRAVLDFWFHPRATAGLRAVAFRPLVLNPDRDPIVQLVDWWKPYQGNSSVFATPRLKP